VAAASQNVRISRRSGSWRCFPSSPLMATILCVREPRVGFDLSQVRETLRAVRSAVSTPPLWTAAGFIFLWNFSPSFGPARVFRSGHPRLLQDFWVPCTRSAAPAPSRAPRSSIASVGAFRCDVAHSERRDRRRLDVGLPRPRRSPVCRYSHDRDRTISRSRAWRRSTWPALLPAAGPRVLFLRPSCPSRTWERQGGLCRRELYDALGLTPAHPHQCPCDRLVLGNHPPDPNRWPGGNALHPEAHVA